MADSDLIARLRIEASSWEREGGWRRAIHDLLVEAADALIGPCQWMRDDGTDVYCTYDTKGPEPTPLGRLTAEGWTLESIQRDEGDPSQRRYRAASFGPTGRWLTAYGPTPDAALSVLADLVAPGAKS